MSEQKPNNNQELFYPSKEQNTGEGPGLTGVQGLAQHLADLANQDSLAGPNSRRKAEDYVVEATDQIVPKK